MPGILKIVCSYQSSGPFAIPARWESAVWLDRHEILQVLAISTAIYADQHQTQRSQ